MKKISKQNLYKLIPAFVCLVSCAITLVTATTAWFSMNKETNSTGMQMTIDTVANLVISDKNDTSDEAISKLVTSSWKDSYVTKAWDTAATALIPSTHDLTVGRTTGLKYNTNPGEVDRSSGQKKGTTELTFAEAVNGTVNGVNRIYYVDYVVYIASLDKPMTASDFSKINFVLARKDELTDDIYKSMAIDIYASQVTAGGAVTAINSTNFIGTLHYDTEEHKTVSTTKFTTIPLNTANSICIVFRCYFDGNVGTAASNAYINSAALAKAIGTVKFDIKIGLE